MYPQCPLCGSQDCERKTHQMKVWFLCRKCGHKFEWRGSDAKQRHLINPKTVYEMFRCVGLTSDSILESGQ